MQNDASGRKVVVAQCKNGLCAGTYAVEDKKLKLSSAFGSHSTMLGLQRPEKLARNLLKRVCDASTTGPDDSRLLAKRPRSKNACCANADLGMPGIALADRRPPTIVDEPPPLDGASVSA